MIRHIKKIKSDIWNDFSLRDLLNLSGNSKVIWLKKILQCTGGSRWRSQCTSPPPLKGSDSFILTYSLYKTKYGSSYPLRGWWPPQRDILDPPLSKCQKLFYVLELVRAHSPTKLLHLMPLRNMTSPSVDWQRSKSRDLIYYYKGLSKCHINYQYLY